MKRIYKRIQKHILDHDYIPVIENNYRMFTYYEKPYWIPARKVPIDQIRIDKNLMSWPNDVNDEMVETIIKYFDIWNWLPLIINKQYYLLDGQHRLEVARRLELSFIDAIIENSELLDTKTPKKRRAKWDIL